LSDKDSPGNYADVIRGILHYWVEHVDAKDTPEGILKWWLPESQGEWGKEDVQKALDFLTSKGWLTKRETTRAKRIYGVNKDRVEEIKTFLRAYQQEHP